MFPKSRFGHNINRAPEQEREVHRKTTYIKETPVGIEVDQEIDIAVFMGFVSCHGSEHPHVLCAPPVREGEDLVPLLDEKGIDVGSRVHASRSFIDVAP